MTERSARQNRIGGRIQIIAVGMAKRFELHGVVKCGWRYTARWCFTQSRRCATTTHAECRVR